jgi:hypothetical protein
MVRDRFVSSVAIVILLLLLAIPTLFAFCAPELVERLEAFMMKKIAPAGDEAMVETWIQWTREGDFDQVERGLDPSLRTDDLRDKLEEMARLIPDEPPRSVKPIGYAVVHHPDSSQTIAITLEYEFQNQWLLATLVKQEQSGVSSVMGFHVNPIPESIESHNRLTLRGKEPVHYVMLLLVFAALAVAIYGVVVCLSTPPGKKKWLWAAVCLIGVGKLALNWTTGVADFTPLWIEFPPSGAAMIPLYGPWMVHASFPVGAAVVLIFRDRFLRSQPNRQSPELPAQSPGASTASPPSA